MKRLAALADRLFFLLLRLHPLAGVSDFYEEMRATYLQAAGEPAKQSAKTRWRRVLREFWDLPGVLLRAWFFRRRHMTESIPPVEPSAPPTPWRTALLSLLPFFLVGPVSLSLSYLPFWNDPLWTRWIWPGETIFFAAVFWAGILLGVRHGSPRWSYPYVVVGIFSITALVNSLLHGTPMYNLQLPLLLLVAAVWTAVTWRWKPFRPFWSHIRQDWTCLSYSLFALVLLLSSTADHDETPRLTVLVLLPSLLSLAGALAHLRAATRLRRILALVAALTLATPVWFANMSTGMWRTASGRAEVLGILLEAYFILLAFLLAPALIGLVKRSAPGKETLS